MDSQTNWAQRERHALTDLMVSVGPDAPTLCEGWNTKDLAAHIAIRERRPDAAVGVVIGALSEHTKKVQSEYTAMPWATLLDMLRVGPPSWNPMSWSRVDNVANLIEFLVHHEDVLRAQEGWQPRVLPDELNKLIMSRLRSGAWLFWRRAKVGVVLTDGHSSIVAKRPPKETGIVTVTGEPMELLLKSFGRKNTMVRVSGTEEDIAKYEKTNLSA